MSETESKRTHRRRRHKKAPLETASEVVRPDSEENIASEMNPRIKSNSSNRKPPARQPSLNNWRVHVPKGSVDAISLEPIRSLAYPPFVLRAAPPFVPVTVWPPSSSPTDIREETQWQKQVLQDQWGDSEVRAVTHSRESVVELSDSNTCPVYHFFDGKVLAYYLVSQLQFIDPLNRRDLTRQEVEQLDLYLRQHKLYSASFASVLEAFDAKQKDMKAASDTQGSNNSSNISASAGRAFLLQQEARGLLEALFSTSTNNANRVSRRQDSQDSQRQARRRNQPNRLVSTTANTTTTTISPSVTTPTVQPRSNTVTDQGILGSHGTGFLIIDDDLNPGLRGGITSPVTNTATRNIQNHSQRVHAFNFPQLAPAANLNHRHTLHRVSSSSYLEETSAIRRTLGPRTESLPISKTLDKISSLVSKTDPKQVEAQRKARQEWLQKSAMIKNSVYDPLNDSQMLVCIPNDEVESSVVQSNDYAKPLSQPQQLHFSESMIERNKVFAEALGVVPATIRGTNSGWTRPTSIVIERDELGNELNTIQYPESLIVQARERIDELNKLEKKWVIFLKDDSAPSISLKPMDKPMRAFVHCYSDYWKLKTTSYDEPPHRYIHCVKTEDSCAPYPFLSTYAARNDRPPLRLNKPSLMDGSYMTTFKVGLDPTSISIRGGPSPLLAEPSPRFAPLLSERERPKLLLQPRSGVTVEEVIPRANSRKLTTEEKAKKEKAHRISVLAAAFASDDESSDWDVGEALYSGDDDK